VFIFSLNANLYSDFFFALCQLCDLWCLHLHRLLCDPSSYGCPHLICSVCPLPLCR
jgi:hypothetical protein